MYECFLFKSIGYRYYYFIVIYFCSYVVMLENILNEKYLYMFYVFNFICILKLYNYVYINLCCLLNIWVLLDLVYFDRRVL